MSTKPKKRIHKIEIDRELCIGAASCIAVAPDLYELDEENIAVLKEPIDADDALVLESAESCPTRAIILYDEEGEQIFPQ